MSNITGYPTKNFSETQKFFILDPNTQAPSFVSGADLVSYLTPSQNYVYAESTRTTAQATDYPVGALIETAGATSAGDNFAAVYLVVAAGEGDFPMDNGNDLLVIRGDEFLREQLAQNTTGVGSDLVAHTGTTDTVTQALDKRTIYVGSVAELETLSLAVGTNVYLTEGGRAGNFVLKSGDLSAKVTADTMQGIYIAPSSDPTGASGAWMRSYNGLTGAVSAQWFGAKPDNSVDAAPSVQSAIDIYKHVTITEGDYKWSTTVNLTGNRALSFSPGAILRPGASNFAMLKHLNATAAQSNILIDGMFASDFGGSSVGVTMIELEDLGTGIEIRNPKATAINTMVNIIDNSFGAKIYSPSSFLVPNPIIVGAGSGTVDVYSPNLDNALDIGGDNTGIGIDLSGSGTIHGGYIQGFASGAKFQKRGQINGTYFERCTGEGVLFNGAFGVTCINNYFFGFAGDAFYRSTNSESIEIINPVMTVSGATTGLFDFDSTNKNCFYTYNRKDDGTLNQLLGITSGISPRATTNQHKNTTFASRDLTVSTSTDLFRVEVQENSATRVEVQVEAIEKTAYFGSIARKFIFLVRRASAAGAYVITPVQTVTDFSLSNSNASYTLDAAVSTASISDNVVGVSLEITTSGSISPGTAVVNARISAETTGNLVRTWTV